MDRSREIAEKILEDDAAFELFKKEFGGRYRSKKECLVDYLTNKNRDEWKLGIIETDVGFFISHWGHYYYFPYTLIDSIYPEGDFDNAHPKLVEAKERFLKRGPA